MTAMNCTSDKAHPDSNSRDPAAPNGHNGLRSLASQPAQTNEPENGAWSGGTIWPRLEELGLGEELTFVRRAGIGGSDANVILSGDEERINRLWREKRGEAVHEDLSCVLPVMLGTWTEDFNRQWFEKGTGQQVGSVGASLVCDIHPWRRCTLDGFVDLKNAVFEAKHVGAFYKRDEVLARYMPQLQHNMAVTGSKLALLSVIFGNHKWEIYEIATDWLYQEELLIAEARFWDYVRTGKVPVPAPVPAPPIPVGVREVCLEGNNSWAAAASDWLEFREAAKRHKRATQELIPRLVDHDPWAHCRRPMDMMRQG